MTTFRVTDEDRYRFDLQGYILLRGVLGAAELEELNRIVDGLEEAKSSTTPDMHSFRTDVPGWGQPFLDLVDHPRVVPYLQEWVDSSVRLDHAYPIFSYKGAPGGPLHGGGNTFHASFYYLSDGSRIRSSLTVVSWALADNPPGRGGFACVPGSHKAQFARPEGCDDVAIEVPAKAGDAIIFTEALTHGTLPWTADHPRRQLFYKYCPGAVTCDGVFWPDDLKARATPSQRRMLERPYVVDKVQGWRRPVDDPEPMVVR